MIMIIIFIQDSPISVINTGIKGGPVVRAHKQKYKRSKAKIHQKIASRLPLTVG